MGLWIHLWMNLNGKTLLFAYWVRNEHSLLSHRIIRCFIWPWDWCHIQLYVQFTAAAPCGCRTWGVNRSSRNTNLLLLRQLLQNNSCDETVVQPSSSTSAILLLGTVIAVMAGKKKTETWWVWCSCHVRCKNSNQQSDNDSTSKTMI